MAALHDVDDDLATMEIMVCYLSRRGVEHTTVSAPTESFMAQGQELELCKIEIICVCNFVMFVFS